MTYRESMENERNRKSMEMLKSMKTNENREFNAIIETEKCDEIVKEMGNK